MAKKLRQQPTLFDTELEVPQVAPASVPVESSTPYEAAPQGSESHALPATPAPESGEPLAALTGPLQKADRVIVVDSHSLIYQVFHAMPAMTGPQGQAVGAIHGFLRDLADLRDQWKPTFLLCAFDLSEVTFRNELYPAYKEHRDPMPGDLKSQLPWIHQALQALDIPILALEGFEADDVLATVVAYTEAAECDCLLVTSDKDCRQLLSERTKMLNLRKKETFGPSHLLELWGVTPEQVVDFQALVGDSADNVPGVPMIGPKFATELLQQFGTLESILEHADEVNGAKRRENLKTYRDQALLSQQLTRLRKDVPITMQWETWRAPNPKRAEMQKIFDELGIRKLSERFLGNLSEPPPAKIVQSKAGYRTIASLEELHDVIPLLKQAKRIAFDCETTSIYARHADPVGYSLAWDDGQAIYIPLQAPSGDPQLPSEAVHQALAPILADPAIGKIGQNIKYDSIVLQGQGISIANICFDTMVADYLIDPGQRNHSLDDIAKRWMNIETIKTETLIGSGKSQRSMKQVPVSLISEYACQDVDLPFQLTKILEPKLIEEDLHHLFDTLELPLISVLADMEFHGIRVDVPYLQAMSQHFEQLITTLHQEVMELAGSEFNPDSPKQLATILFDRLGLPVIKKTKTGPSTDAEVLQELAPRHPLPAKIIEYRQATKLKSTYIDALPEMVCPKTGRVHTSFRQDIAATGRLSSTEPNLQNIPVRTEEGRRIRGAFTAGFENWMLMTADYSQIELRVLAHYCQDPSLRRAFEQDQDIHAMVAAEVYGVPQAEVSSSMRRSAKAINFGIVYGQSPFGLAKSLGISKDEAASFIDAYFAKYPGVQSFIAETLVNCRRQGFVTTMSGRKRWLKGLRDFNSLNDNQRRTLIEPERMAVNTIIQGSAADMIKMAMIALHRRLKEEKIQAQMLLQIHDELIFEVHPDASAELADLVRSEMTTVMPLAVPLKVDIKTGTNWAACEPLDH